MAGSRTSSSWPRWAAEQLMDAATLAGLLRDGRHLAAELYDGWFCPVVTEPGDALRDGRPLAGMYRSAHAGGGVRTRADGMQTVRRNDVIGRDGWWRTWGAAWVPPRRRAGMLRLFLTPRPGAHLDVVHALTAALLDAQEPWLLACATDPRRLRRTGGFVLDLPHVDMVPEYVWTRLGPLLRPVRPPLCLPVAPGVGAAQSPDNGMTFGEHRCHLVATGLRDPAATGQELDGIAAVFRRHGVDPRRPWRTEAPHIR